MAGSRQIFGHQGRVLKDQDASLCVQHPSKSTLSAPKAESTIELPAQNNPPDRIRSEPEEPPPGPLCPAEVLIQKRVLIVSKLDVDSIWPGLKDCLPVNLIDHMESESSRLENVRILLDHLYRQTVANYYLYFNVFLKLLGGTQPHLFNALVGRPPTKDEADFCMKDISQQLKTTIREQLEDFGWPDEDLIRLKKVTSNLNTESAETASVWSLGHLLDGSDSNTGTSSMRNILEVNPDKPQRVCIVGHAGIGKTTTLNWLARKWAGGRWARLHCVISATVSDGNPYRDLYDSS